jgi:glycosyltransferase involved in cell wall biosynthesis
MVAPPVHRGRRSPECGALNVVLRVNLYGNVCNNAYVICKFLRRRGVDAHLFLERGFPWLPHHDDPELEGNYPDWIHLVGDLRWRRYGVLDGSFVRQLADCDVVHTFYWGPIWARKTGRPYMFQSYGGDLRTMPFMTDSMHHRYLAARQRRAIQAADLVARPNLNITDDAVRRLGLERVVHLPLMLDADRFRPLPAADTARLREQYKVDWLFFHPTRQSWIHGDIGESWKANDLVFRGFARYLRETSHSALLLAVAHGPDASASQALVEQLGISGAVRWMRPMRRAALVDVYNAADLVLDQLGRGDFGTIALEAWSCARPVVINIKAHRDFEGEHPPALLAETEEDIYRTLVQQTTSRGSLRALGERSRDWILRHQDGDAVVDRYIGCYERILASRAKGGA